MANYALDDTLRMAKGAPKELGRYGEFRSCAGESDDSPTGFHDRKRSTRGNPQLGSEGKVS